ncbi:MAG: 6-phosphogluconolactonase [Thermoguttaceae bacterium]|jgi:6-phosphogluconolactonase
MTQPELMVYHDAEELAAAAAERISRAAAESIAARDRFTLCLTGGSTPRRTYELLARQDGASITRRALPDAKAKTGHAKSDLWSRTSLFFGDERFVPPDDDRSNYKMVRESLLQNAPIAEDQVFAIPTHLATPQQAAEEYARTLKTFFGTGIAWPEFDLVLLGLGEDGHTASLFPGAAALRVIDRWATFSPPGVLPPPVDRVTLTFPVFNAARQVVFLVSGASKAEACADVYKRRVSVEQRPAVEIRPVSGHPVWLVDRAAAAWRQL